MVDVSSNLDNKAHISQDPASQPLSELEKPVAPQDGDEVDQTEKRNYPSGIQRALILGPVTLTYFLFFLDLAVVSTATPAITSRFNSLVDVGWHVYPKTFSVRLTDHPPGTAVLISSATQRFSP